MLLLLRLRDGGAAPDRILVLYGIVPAGNRARPAARRGRGACYVFTAVRWSDVSEPTKMRAAHAQRESGSQRSFRAHPAALLAAGRRFDPDCNK